MGCGYLLRMSGVRFWVHDPDQIAQALLQEWAPVYVNLSDLKCSSSPKNSPLNILSDERDWSLTFSPLNRFQEALETQLHYRREGDLCFYLDQKQRRAHAWVDGSQGAIEASVQVLLQCVLRIGGGLLVHASAGVYQGETWLIPGVSGSGKSTAVRAGGFELILSDEMIALTPTLCVDHPSKSSSSNSYPLSESTAPYEVWGTPFWSEGRSSPYSNQAYPLHRITFPIKAASPKLSSCLPPTAARMLLKAVTSYERGLKAHADLLEIACQVVDSTPCADLHFPKEGPWRSSL